MPVAHPETLRETVKLLYMQGIRPSVISSETGVKPGTLKTWANRHGWASAVSNGQAIVVQRGKTIASRLIGDTSALREELRSEAESQVKTLRQTPIRNAKSLANTPNRQGRAAVLKTLVESVSLIEDWDAQKRSGLVLCDLLTGEPGSTTEIAAQVENMPCVSGATTGSVPTGDLNALTATSEQAADTAPLADTPAEDNGSCAKSDAQAP